MLDGDLDEPQPPPQRQVRRSRTRTQALSCTTHNYGNRAPGARLEDVGARLFGDAADAKGEDEVAVKGDSEVRGERKEVGRDSGKELGEAGC